MTDHTWTPEPWDDYGRRGSPRFVQLSITDYYRAVDCVNALAGIADPEAWAREHREVDDAVALAEASPEPLSTDEVSSMVSSVILREHVVKAGIKNPEHLRELMDAVEASFPILGGQRSPLSEDQLRLRNALARVRGES